MSHATKPQPVTTAEPDPGASIGGYTLQSKIGAGGFGSVWLAKGTGGETVAVKVLHANLLDHRVGSKGPTVADRFVAEARMLAALEHRGLVQVHSIIDQREDGTVAYVMEYLEGADLVRCEADLGLAALLDLFAQVADTLHYLHANGIVHRDIKPANLLITAPTEGSDGRRVAKVIDLGIAKQIDSDMTATATGTLLGSVRSMAPETFAGAVPGAPCGAIDQWALGVTLFECLSGRAPFDGPSMIDIVHRIEGAAPAPFALRRRFANALCGDALEALVLRCLEKDPRSRFENLAAVAAAIRVVAAAEPEPDRTLYDPSRPLMAVRATDQTMHASAQAMIDGDDEPSFEPVEPGVIQAARFDATVPLPVLMPVAGPRAIVEVNPSEPVPANDEPRSAVVHAETVGGVAAAVGPIQHIGATSSTGSALLQDVESPPGFVISPARRWLRALMPVWLSALVAVAFATGVALGWLVRA